METVNAFNSELCSLYSTKPPISKTKMVELTKLAMKAAKFYKHVVQSIEKFIHKCHPEFKIPGLYVIDSIVRQSRHQFGADKDIFSLRFSKNIATTFHNLLTCPAQDICKIIRVLNLWQKNCVFPPNIIQPLLDMAADPLNVAVYLTAQKSIQRAAGGMVPSVPQSIAGSVSTSRTNARSSSGPVMDSDVGTPESQNDVLKAISQLLQQAQQPPTAVVPLLNSQLQLHLIQQQLLQQLHVQQQPEPPLSIDSNLMAQIQALTAALMSRLGAGGGGGVDGAGVGEGSVTSEELVSTMDTSPMINKFVDVSYTESDLDDDRRFMHSCSSLSLVSDVPIERGNSKRLKLKISNPQLSSLGQSSKLWSSEEDVSHTFDQSHDEISDIATPRSSQPQLPTVSSEDCFLQSTPCEDELPLAYKLDRRDHLERGKKRGDAQVERYRKSSEWSSLSLREPPEEFQIRKNSEVQHENLRQEHRRDEITCQDQISTRSDRRDRSSEMISCELESSDFRDSRTSKTTLRTLASRSVYQSAVADTERKSSRRRSRSQSRSRSRSRSSRNSHRSSSRSQSRTVSSEKKLLSPFPDHDCSWRRLEHEHPVSRWLAGEHQKCLVPLREQHVSIISLTVWIGNVNKQIKEELLRTEVSRFGKASIDFVPQRGCAFACFETRQEAERAIEGLNNMKVMERTLKVAWAPNSGIKKSEFRNHWDVNLGVTYIPWDRLPPDLNGVAVGAVVDEESLPEPMRSSSESVVHGFQDDQMTSNEVTSSTDCQQDGLALSQVPVASHTATLTGISLPLIAPGSLLPVTYASNISSGEKSKEKPSSVTNSVSSLPTMAERDTTLKVQVELKVDQDPLMPEIAMTCSPLVQGIQNILSSANTSNAAASAQSIPGIIAPGGTVSTAAAGVHLPPSSGVFPSICGFNPHVPPPGFLPTFDPTRPPPSFGQPSPTDEAASLPERKREECSVGMVEDTSENMDLDDSGSSSQGDDQDFLESRIELVRAGPLSSGLKFVGSRGKDINTNSCKLATGKADSVDRHLADAPADSNCHSNNSISSTAVSRSDIASLRCTVACTVLVPSESTNISSFERHDGIAFTPFLKQTVAPLDQNPSCPNVGPGNVPVILDPAFDRADDGTGRTADGFTGTATSDLAIQPNLGPIGLGNLSNTESKDLSVPPRHFVGIPNVSFQGHGMQSHGTPNTEASSGSHENVPYFKERRVLGASPGVCMEAAQLQESLGISKSNSKQFSEMNRGIVPINLGITGSPSVHIPETASAKNVLSSLPGNQNQMSFGPGSCRPHQVPLGMLWNNGAPDSCNRLSGRLDGLRQLSDGSERSIGGFAVPDSNPQMMVGQPCLPLRMPNDRDGPLRMPGRQMQIIGDTREQNQMLRGGETRPFLGPEIQNQTSVAHFRLPFGQNGMQNGGPNQISDIPPEIKDWSYGNQGPNLMSVGGKERALGLLEARGATIHMSGMPAGSLQLPPGLGVVHARPPQIDGSNSIPNMPGLHRGAVHVSAQMPRICDGGMNLAIGSNRMPIPGHIPGAGQMPGSFRIPGPHQTTGSEQLSGQVQNSAGAAGLLGAASGSSSVEKDGMRPPFMGMFPFGIGGMPSGLNSVNVISPVSFSGPALGIARMAPSDSGVTTGHAQHSGFPMGPDRMPSLGGVTGDIKGHMPQSHEGISQYIALSSGQGSMGLGSGPPAPCLGLMPAGINMGPNRLPSPSVGGMLQNSCAVPVGLNRPAFILSNVPPSTAPGLNRPPFGSLLMSSNSFGVRGAPGSLGPGLPNAVETVEQPSYNRNQPFDWNKNVEIGLKHSLPGSSNANFQRQGFQNNQPTGNSDNSHPFLSQIGSDGFDQYLNSGQSNYGILKNAENIQIAGQQFLPSGICSGIEIQGLVGKSVDGKASTEPVGLFGLGNKRTAIPSLFSNLNNANLVSGQQAYAANDQFFLKPQFDNLQQDETRRWNNIGDDVDEEDGRKAQRHIRRSDLFPSLKQRGRHQHRSGPRWHDRRHDRRDYATREFKDHSHDHGRHTGSRGNHMGNLCKHQYASDGPSKECHDLSDKAGIQFGIKPDLGSVFKPVVKSEIDSQKTSAEVENQRTEVTNESSDVLDSVVSASEKDCS